MALRHQQKDSSQYMCRKRTGTSIGLVCEKHEDRCVICDSFSQLELEVRVCDDCGYSKTQLKKCIVCGVPKAVNPGLYCKYCVALENDRNGCPVAMATADSKRDARVLKASTVKID
eukprot:Tbor_TRINITY_DN4896_c0_g2::TRINITY_DN4896_c0_g2_i2::g.1283::m.1283/K12834/PHF5A; PHD finger-like domain-containing protein 5A